MGVEERPNFETLSAFVDNELDPVERERVLSWVARDNVVAREVQALRALKANVAILPRTGTGLPVPTRGSKSRNPTLTLIAASLVLFVILLGGYRLEFGIPFSRDGLISEQLIAAYDDWHPDHAVAVQTSPHNAQFFQHAGLSHLGEETLRLGDDLVTHNSYVGPGGCRVSIFEFPHHALDPQATSELIRRDNDALAIGWTSRRSTYVMVARRMNDKRFDAIATALRDLGSEERELIVAEHVIPRSPCVG